MASASLLIRLEGSHVDDFVRVMSVEGFSCGDPLARGDFVPAGTQRARAELSSIASPFAKRPWRAGPAAPRLQRPANDDGERGPTHCLPTLTLHPPTLFCEHSQQPRLTFLPACYSLELILSRTHLAKTSPAALIRRCSAPPVERWPSPPANKVSSRQGETTHLGSTSTASSRHSVRIELERTPPDQLG